MNDVEIMNNLDDKSWRLNNLYKIRNRYSAIQDFKMLPAQNILFKSMCNRNLILKSRQYGITTFMIISMVDDCLFTPNTKCCIVPYRGEQARHILNENIACAYENLPAIVRKLYPIKIKTKNRITFNNDSFLNVSTLIPPSTTFQQIYASEYGYLCQKAPNRAMKMQTELNSAGENCVVTIDSSWRIFESTGDFNNKLLKSINIKHDESIHSNNDYKFFFFGWTEGPDCVLSEGAEDVIICERLQDYFKEIESSLHITLSVEQKAWYARKEDAYGVDMKHEFPSTMEEMYNG